MQTEYRPVQKSYIDYQQVEHVTEYVPQYRNETKIEYVPQERVETIVEYQPVQRTHVVSQSTINQPSVSVPTQNMVSSNNQEMSNSYVVR